MESLLLGLRSQLNDMTKTLNKLEADNATLRNEILGIGASTNSGEECMGILEQKTLRQVVQEIQFDVRAMKDRIELEGAGPRVPAEQEQAMSSSDPNKPAFIENSNLMKKCMKEYPVVDIKHKTIAEEREWMKSTFQEERRKLRDPVDGASLLGKTVESISSSIPLTNAVGATCVVKLSNHLSSTLTCPEVYSKNGTKNTSDLKNVIGHTSEAISFEGGVTGFCMDMDGIISLGTCGFLLSVKISCSLRFAVCCSAPRYGNFCYLRVGFTPEDVRTDESLLDNLGKMSLVPDVWKIEDKWYRFPLEAFVSHGKLLVRVHMTVGPRSVVHVDILEVDDDLTWAPLIAPKMIAIMDRKSLSSGSAYEDLLHHFDCINSSEGLASNVEIVNCLNVLLKNSQRYIRKCGHNNFMPPVIYPFSREIFFASGNEVVEAIFAYEIESTDLGLVVAFRVQASQNSFAVALVPTPKVTDEEAFSSFMDPKQWKTHIYKKYATAKDGEQIIQARNIKAAVSMSETKKCHLNIRVFAV